MTDDEPDRPQSGPRPVVRRKTTYSVTEAAELLGIHRETAYLQIAAGTFPVPAIKVGRQLKIPRVPLDKMLGIDDPD
jgi:excisionase family DNA binding protein